MDHLSIAALTTAPVTEVQRDTSLFDCSDHNDGAVAANLSRRALPIPRAAIEMVGSRTAGHDRLPA
jgi:hypothetical protein